MQTSTSWHVQDVKLSDLEKIGVLGSGAFGQVMLVKYEGNYMALKTLSKQQILEMGLQVRRRETSGPMAPRRSFPYGRSALPGAFLEGSMSLAPAAPPPLMQAGSSSASSCKGAPADAAAPVQEHVKREKQIMAECDCPFMVNLVTSFKDATHLFMLMECVMGGELFTYLQSRPGPLKEDHARFYAASVVLGLEYMQERNLLWRRAPSGRLMIRCA